MCRNGYAMLQVLSLVLQLLMRYKFTLVLHGEALPGDRSRFNPLLSAVLGVGLPFNFKLDHSICYVLRGIY